MINTSPNMGRCYLMNIKNIIQSRNFKLKGDILEFGTCTCQSALSLADMMIGMVVKMNTMNMKDWDLRSGLKNMGMNLKSLTVDIMVVFM